MVTVGEKYKRNKKSENIYRNLWLPLQIEFVCKRKPNQT